MALVVAVVVYLVARAPHAESSPVAVIESPARDVALVDAGAVDPTVEVVRRSVVAAVSPAGVSIAGTNVLRVILEGITEEEARTATVTLAGVEGRAFDGNPSTPDRRRADARWIQGSPNRVVESGSNIRESWPCQGSTSEFDLDQFLAVVAARLGDPRVDELEVHVDHPLHLLELARVPLSRGVQGTSGQTLHEVRVRLTRAAVIHGRLAREDGAPAAEGLVGALLLEDTTWERRATNGSTLTDVPIEGEGRAVECAADDGAFELRVPTSGRHALACFEEGRRPTTARVDAIVGARVDVGTIVLAPGHAITGRALRHGDPLVGARVQLAPPRVYWAADPADVEKGMNAWIGNARTFDTGARSVTLAWLDNGFESMRRRVDVDEDGAFAFHGLAPCEYRLRVVELAGSRFLPNGWDDPALGEEGPDELIVHAPAHGVVLEFDWTSMRFELEGDIDGDDAGRLVLKTRSLYPGNANTSIPEYWSTQLPLSGSEPTFVLQAPSDTRMLGEVTFPGRQPVSLDFRTPRSGGEGVVPIRLVRVEEAATLVIELENPQAELPATFTVTLKRGEDDATPDTRRVEVVEGRLRVGDLLPGHHRVSVCAGEDPNHPGIFFANEFALDLHPGLVVTRSIRMQQGAGLRVTLRDEDGEPMGGQYEFYDDAGNRVSLCLVVRDRWEPGSDRWATLSRIHPYGTHESSNPLHPGRYRLVLVSPGHANRTVTVDLRAGRFEAVDVTLSR